MAITTFTWCLVVFWVLVGMCPGGHQYITFVLLGRTMKHHVVVEISIETKSYCQGGRETGTFCVYYTYKWHSCNLFQFESNDISRTLKSNKQDVTTAKPQLLAYVLMNMINFGEKKIDKWSIVHIGNGHYWEVKLVYISISWKLKALPYRECAVAVIFVAVLCSHTRHWCNH